MDSVIASVIREFADFTLEDVSEEPSGPRDNYCDYARLFERWAVDLLREFVEREPDRVRIAQAKAHLVDRYFEWRAAASKSHRNRIGEKGHICIFHVFERTYQQIHVVELTLAPTLVVVAPPQPPALPEIAGIYLGEVVDGES